MKTSRIRDFRPIAGKIMMGFVLAAMIGSMDVASSFGEDRGGRPGEGRYEQRGRGHDRGRGYDRDRYDHRGRGYYYEGGRRVYRPYGYSERVYVPPPVYYEPPPPPGVRIFLPF